MENNRPSKEYQPISGAVNLPLVLEAAGIDLKYATKEYCVGSVLPAAFTVFSDGERVFNPTNSGDVLEYDTILQKLSALVSRYPLELGVTDEVSIELHKFARYCGMLLEQWSRTLLKDYKQDKQTMVDIGKTSDNSRLTLGFREGYYVSLPPNAWILDVGPGLAGRNFINMLNRGFPNFRYWGISRGPFVSEFLRSYCLATRGNIENFGMIENGASWGIERLISHAPNARVTAIIFNGLYEVNASELEAALRRAYLVTAEGGYLLLGAPTNPVIKGGSTFARQTEIIQPYFDMVGPIYSRYTGNRGMGRAVSSNFGIFSKEWKGLIT